jgi:D-glycero-alpha-D-manno-heptose-7-phosphate kinase
VAAFGGINCYEIDEDGTVRLTPLGISPHCVAELESNLLLFYTGIKRNASQILGRQKLDEEKGNARVVEAMHEIKKIAYKIRDSLANGDTRSFGELLDTHWRAKKALSDEVSNDRIDQLYQIAKHNGALGGKIVGAGGGGFFMFYSENGKQRLREAMSKEGLKEVRFRFDFDGSKTLLNI